MLHDFLFLGARVKGYIIHFPFAIFILPTHQNLFLETRMARGSSGLLFELDNIVIDRVIQRVGVCVASFFGLIISSKFKPSQDYWIHIEPKVKGPFEVPIREVSLLPFHSLLSHWQTTRNISSTWWVGVPPRRTQYWNVLWCCHLSTSNHWGRHEISEDVSFFSRWVCVEMPRSTIRVYKETAKIPRRLNQIFVADFVVESPVEIGKWSDLWDFSDENVKIFTTYPP